LAKSLLSNTSLAYYLDEGKNSEFAMSAFKNCQVSIKTIFFK